jgi:hypothetical protein
MPAMHDGELSWRRATKPRRTIASCDERGKSDELRYS